VGDVEEASPRANCVMLFGKARILNRQLEPGELNHPSSSRQVFLKKGRFRSCTDLAHWFAFLPVNIRVKITITEENSSAVEVGKLQR
jgi:hypothetical protein